ncbi:MAG: cytochrome c3 family protein [Coriobacteriales bacterium]|jgi:fumarate reductase flavoprotein subunit|nr:cytochrome c3 family protein [Coriobacteriales bacterium]
MNRRLAELWHKQSKKLCISGFCVAFVAAILVACSPAPQEQSVDDAQTVELAQTKLTVADATAMNKHVEDGVACTTCHGQVSSDEDYAMPAEKTCLSCHAQEDVIASTADYDDPTQGLQNPHDSHAGTPRCTLCHSNHADSSLYCNECHLPGFGFAVP